MVVVRISPVVVVGKGTTVITAVLIDHSLVGKANTGIDTCHGVADAGIAKVPYVRSIDMFDVCFNCHRFIVRNFGFVDEECLRCTNRDNAGQLLQGSQNSAVRIFDKDTVCDPERFVA